MVDIPLLPTQSQAAAIDQIEVAVLKRLDQLLHIGGIRLGQQIGLAERHANPWRLRVHIQPAIDAIGFCDLWRQPHAV